MAKTAALVELYYSGAWHDLTAADEVYTRDGILITRGRNNEAGRTNPSNVGLSLKSTTAGKYVPRNPTGPLYGVIGRNTPLRVSTTDFDVTADSFNRVSAEGWGTCEFGGTEWVHAGIGGAVSASDYWIETPLTAIHTVTATTAYRLSYITDHIPNDVVATVRLRALDTSGSSDITGGDIEGGLMLRVEDVNNYYHPRVEFNADQSITASIHTPLGGSLGSATPAAAITYSGQWLVVKAEVVGTTIRMKVWEDGNPEPAAWDLSVTNADITGPGGAGIRSGVAAGNTNTGRHINYRNWTLSYAPRVTAEVEAWPARWNTAGTDVWAPIQGWGIMRRLNAPGTSAPSLSAMRRAILRANPVAYWSMDDPDGATVMGSGIQGGSSFSVAPEMVLARVDGPAGGSSSYPDISAVTRSFARGSVDMAVTTAWTVDFAVYFDPDYPALDTTYFADVRLRGGTLSSVLLRWSGSTSLEAIAVDTENTVFGAALLGTTITAGEWHHVRMVASQSGANIAVRYDVDGVTSAATQTWASATLGAIRRVDIPGAAYINPPGVPISVGEVAVWDTAAPSLTAAQAYAALIGHAGETAADRIARLCAEESIAVTILGDASLSTPVGPQLAQPPLESMFAAAEADGGILYEPRGFVGLSFRTLRSLYNQTAVASLDYAAGGQVAPPLDPVPDTDHLANDVTVVRVGGASARVVQESGPLNVGQPGADPDAVGRYDKEFRLALYDDDQPEMVAGWLKHLGTHDEERFPVVNVDFNALAKAELTTLAGQVASLDVGDQLQITSPPGWLPPEAIVQLAQGFTETLDSHRRLVAANTVPGRPYTVGVLDSATLGRLGTDGCALDEPLDTTETAVDVVSDTTPWIDSATYAAQFPFSIMVGGEEMSVTACAGTGLTQTFTVVRSVNGVVKTHDDGTAVQLTTPLRLAL